MPYTKEALEAQAKHWEEEAHKQRRFRVIEGILGLFALGALISFTIWYTAHAVSEADKRWCAFMVPLNERYQQLPDNADPEAKAFAVRLDALVKGLKC